MILETDKKIIGNKFKEYRKSKQLTQFELAEKVGLNENKFRVLRQG